MGMLVLSRKLDEEVVIGEGEIVVSVIDIRADKVRLGIIAPEGMPVNRREVYESIRAGGKLATEVLRMKLARKGGYFDTANGS